MSKKIDSKYHQVEPKTGIIVVNFGSPMKLKTKAIRSFLYRLLMDQRVVSLPRWLWWPILCGAILPFRPNKVKRDYAKIWLKNGSPLLVYHRDIVKKLRKNLVDCVVEEAYLYADPTIEDAWHSLKSQGVKEVVMLPLYPQYCSATTASVFDEWSTLMKRESFVPGLRFIQSYHDHPQYINILASNIKTFWQANGQSKHLVFSYHGIPQQKFKSGDPYYCYCHKTTRLVAEQLNLTEKQYSMAFQSRFGRAKWLTPYLNDHIKALSEEGISNLDVICPGFSIDCIETLHEIGVDYANEAKLYGVDLKLIPCFNHSDDAVDLYSNIIFPEIS